MDQAATSVVSGKTGHKSEFVTCHETRQPLLAGEAERCAQTGRTVRPGILVACAATGKRVLPSELEASAVSGRQALRNMLVQSSVSGARFLEPEGVRSAYGKFCAPVEAKHCEWSGTVTHPDDLRTCSLLGLNVHFQFLTDETNRLQAIDKLLRGVRRTGDAPDRWEGIRAKATGFVSGKCRIEAAELSPDGRSLAVCAEVKSLLGFRTQYAGLLYSLDRNAIVGRIAIIKRDGRNGEIIKAA